MTASIGIDVGSKLQAFKQEFAKEFIARVIARSPEDTGLMKKSWVIQVLKGEIDLTNTAKNKQGDFYAQFPELGTEHYPPRAMIATTMLEIEDIVKVAMERAGL